MKPHKLSIAGLQSFREQQDIDFSRLSDIGMFGIFGPTGSGKSTILDAITLALYGKIGRAKSGKQGIVNESETHASVSFEFSLGTDSERQVYRVERKYRTRDHVSVNSTLSRLVEVRQDEEIVLADQENAVNEKVVDILGITLDDFVRAVVLPQGKFSDFLTLAGVNRRKMLERLFSLEQYGDLLAYRVKKRKDETANRYSALQGEMLGIGDASREAVDGALVKLLAAKELSQQAGEYFDEVRRIAEDAAKVVELQTQMLHKNQELASHRERSAEIAAIDTRIVQAEKAERVNPWLEKATEARLRCETAEKSIETAIAQEIAAKTTCTEKQLEYVLKQESRRNKEPGLIVKREQVGEAQLLETQLVTEENKLAEMAGQLSQLNTTLQAVNGEFQKKTNQISRMDQDFIALQDDLAGCQVASERRSELVEAGERVSQWEHCRKITVEAIAERNMRDKEMQAAMEAVQARVETEKQTGIVRAQLEEKLNRLQTGCPMDGLTLAEEESRLVRCELHVRNFGQVQVEMDHAAEKLEELQRKHTLSIRETENAEYELQTMRRELEQAQNELNEAFQNNKRKMAVMLAQDLMLGTACPVCGSLEHPKVACQATTDASDELAERLKVLADEKQSALIQTETRLNEARSKSVFLAAQIAAGQNQCKDRRKQLAVFCGELVSELGLADGITEIQICLSAVAERRQQHDEKKKLLEKWQRSKEEVEAKLEELRKQEAGNLASLAAARQKQESAATEQDKIMQNVLAAQERFETACSLVARSAVALGASGDNSVTDQVAFIKKIAIEINRMDAAREELAHKISHMQAERKKMEEEHSILRSRIQDLELKQVGKRTDHDNLSVGLLANRQRLEAVTGGISATELLKTISEEIAELQWKENTARTTWENADKQRQTASAAVAAATAALGQNRENSNLAEMQWKREMENAGFTDGEEVKTALLSPGILEKLRNTVRDYRESGFRLEAERKVIEKELDGRSITENEWDELKRKLSQSETEKNEMQRASIEAEQTHRELSAKNMRWSEINAEMNLLKQSLDNLEKIYGLIRGNMLVEFLAQEQMKVVLHNASERLKQLTHNRYALEIDSEGNFLIRDDANGGARRPAASLSGGETFQTSLALALALSDQIQLRGKYPLEFFFLDEGFGSLDRATLDLSMATLERLRHDRLTIGIISHVEDLQQRMPRRLIVSQPDMLGHGSRVKIEIA